MLSEERFNELVQKFQKIDPLMVLGDLGVDKYTYGEVSRISPEAPVPILEVQKEWLKLGLAANVSDNLSSLGVKSTLCGVIGNDHHAQTLEEQLERIKVSTWGVIRDHSRQTTFKERVLTSTQQICRIDYESKAAISQDSFDKILSRLEEFVSAHKCLIIEDYGKGVLSEKLVQEAIVLFQNQGKLVAIDPSRLSPPQWYRGADILKPNLKEAQMIVQSLGEGFKNNPEELAQIIHQKLAIAKVVITLGSQGMAIWDSIENSYQVIPTVAREVYDVSGAGDTTIATLMSALASGASLSESAWLANCAAGVVVGKKGTATVSEVELRDFYHSLKTQWGN